ncbi:hypothetical protein B0H14DRAFT_2630683 [Mycena olivaceomarginata]|nr:hypothetical protein B0H14DRAFT_2630683 [Mycena olivaceomarginata]
MSTKKPKTPAHPRSKKASLDEKARHTQAQADYRARNLEATREKAKLRMRRRRAQIKESEESSKEAAEQRREADAEYREMKRMRTYVDRHGLLALTNHYIPLKQQAGAKYMPGILAEGKKWAKTKEARAVEADYKRRIKAAGPFDKSEMFFPSNNYKSTEDHDTHSSKSYWLVPDVGLFTSKTAANSQCGPDVEGRWKQHARRRHAEEEWASICARHHHHPSPTNEDDDEVVPDSEAENDGDNDNRGSVPVSRALTMAPAPRPPPPQRHSVDARHSAPAHSAPARSAPARSAPAFGTRVRRPRSMAVRSPTPSSKTTHCGDRRATAFGRPVYLRFERHLRQPQHLARHRGFAGLLAHPFADRGGCPVRSPLPFLPAPWTLPSRAPSTTVCKHKARTRAAPPVATLITSSPAPASPRPPAPVSARAPTTIGWTAPAPALAHAPAPALACESTASPTRMAARELNSRAGVHLAPPAVLAPALELVSAPDSNGDFATLDHAVRRTSRPGPRTHRPRLIFACAALDHRHAPANATSGTHHLCDACPVHLRSWLRVPEPSQLQVPEPRSIQEPKTECEFEPRFYGVGVWSLWSLELSVLSMFSRKSNESKRQKKSPSPERTSFPVFVNVQRKTLYKSLSMALEEMGQGESIQTVYGSEEVENILSGLAD